MQRCDYAIIGGGIVGLSVAWAILERQPRARIMVFEKENDWCRHQTGRNSGVIHSGIYYQPGSLKARLCREGNRRLIEFCDQHELEPHVSCLAGLHVSSTGIVNYAVVGRKLVELIAAHGGDLRLNTEVLAFRQNEVESVLETSNGSFGVGWIISCAGLHSDRVARLAGANPEARIVPFRGEYYELKPERRNLVRNLIYPVPDPQFPFLGVHFTRMIDGSVHAGPNAVLSLKREGYHRTAFNLRDFTETLSYIGFWRLAAKHGQSGLQEIHRSFSKKAFLRSLQKLIPGIREDDLIPSEAGVRAQALRPDGGLVDDFLMVHGKRALHVCNAPSPAATASLEIGRMIAGQVPALDNLS